MYILMFVMGFTLTGGKCIINGDMMDNYIPAIRNLCRDILNGESIFYSWNYGMGMNTSLYNAYYSFSPLNILYLIFYNCRIDLVTVLCIVLKTGLAALGFQIYIISVNKIDGLMSVIFSLFYSMCSFQIAYNVSNIIWLDALYMLPLVCACVYRLVEERKWIGLSVCYAYIFISNFYMGYMIAITGTMFLVLFVFAYAEKEKRRVLEIIGRYIISAFLAIAISAWVWVPTLFFMIGGNNVSASIALIGKLNKNGLDIINQLFWGESGGYDALFPYIYCGIPALILTPVFFFKKNIDKKVRIGYAVVLAILFISCMISPLYAAWHGFDDPNSYPYRFSYIISFVLCTVTAIVLDKLEKNDRWKMLITVALAVVVYIVEIFWQDSRFDSTLLSNSWSSLVLNGVVIIIWLLVLTIYTRDAENVKSSLIKFMILITVIESISNGHEVLSKEGLDISTRIMSESWILWDDIEKTRASRINEDEDLFRVNAVQGMGVSTGTTYGYNNISYFSSAENVILRKALSKLGLLSSQRICLNYGLTEPVKMLLGIKYDTFISRKTEDSADGKGYEEASVVPNECALNIGYMVAGTSEDYVLEGNNAFENINNLLSTICGEKVCTFSSMKPDDIYITGAGIDLYNDGEQYGLHYDEVTPVEDAKLVFNYDSDSDVPSYGYIQNKEPAFFRTFYLDGGYESSATKWGAVTTSYIKEMEKSDTGYSMTIKQAGSDNNVAFDNILFYTYDSEPVESVYANLSKEQLETIEWRDGYYRGKLEVSDDKRLLFTSIPYENGWKAYVNGEEQNIVPLVNDAFIGLEIPGVGTYDIEFIFEAPGKNAGMAVSGVGILILVAATILETKRKKASHVEKEC